ncbi:MAG: hypothetical protein GF353_04775 [Candidatus Lokiarchaeota archaeon]|nr:hypothetical protein [Candidatus Lokiarchaeota archaeon]
MNKFKFREEWDRLNKEGGYNEPFPEYVEIIGKKIKNFMISENRKYQGATGNARGLLDALLEYINRSDLRDNKIERFIDNINCILKFLLSVRLTSQVPLNTSFFIRKKLEMSELSSVEQAKEILRKEIEFHKTNYNKTEKTIANHFKTRIIDRCESYGIDKLVIGSHCHSGVVRKAIINSKDYVKQVVIDKTEPEQQGILTAHELLKEGIPVKLINLSQYGHEFRTISLFMFGIDAVSADGVVLNKTGTRMIATLAKTKDLPVYFLGSTYKYARDTLLGGLVKVEQRQVEEKILFNHLKVDLSPYYGEDAKFNDNEDKPLLTVRFTAFDTTKPDFYDSVVSEVGFLSMREAFQIIWEEYL